MARKRWWCSSTLVRRRLRDPRFHRKDLPAKGLHVPPGDKLPASAIHYVQLLAAVAVVGIRVVVVIDALQLPSGGLVPQLLLPGNGLTVGGFLLARPLVRRGSAILEGLLTSPTDPLLEFLDLAAVSGAVASGGMNWA